ncbi:MAG: tyrosine protein phosphatase [Acidobacteria bacterium]|nr:tyrosine protein phosphatase [Acidobacteriota bacterium]
MPATPEPPNQTKMPTMPMMPTMPAMPSMVDIHCHILPETDDGAVSLEESVAMARAAAADGIKTIIATPHMFDGVHETPDKETIRRRIGVVMEACGGCVNIVPGGEVRYSYEIFQETSDPGTRIKLNGTSYMLLEFPFQAVPPNIEMTIFQILNAGITPVIAHPERNRRIQEQPGILADLVERGAFAQIDAGSLTKSFGPEAYHTAKKIIEAGLSHFIATDAHHQDRRRPVLSAAAKIAAEWGGEEYARAMVEDNPEALINDRAIPFQPDPDLEALLGRKMKKSWFAFWK